ncbi:2-hydroxy-3-oxopropionate reductase [Stackebrandtia nassauensis DSM 44728]|uniref:2-hydroxy-3-oxopropionate reductase n=2 Tax=Stackebrandtia TaxID=283810 RepID=D3Q653_STANL|nr:2-hydroxy-3-oxopropionate reductase [Stackebrandtia nassauensis DSM 44728]
MTTIGFIGLGIMGAPMAKHLVDAGHQVHGFDLSADATAALAAGGGKAAGSIAEAVNGADLVITMLPADPHVETAVLGEDGVLAHAKTGSLLIDMSTVSPQTSQAVAEAGKARGVRVLDAPVSGGQAGAVEGVLSIMVGGDESDFRAAAPVFDAFGKTVVHVGPHGAGQVVKAANQLLVGGIIALNAEALVLMEASGVDPRLGLEVLNGGLAGSTVLTRKMDNFVNRSYDPGFRIDLHHKDMGIAQNAARGAEVALPLTAAVAQLVAAARAQGLGDRDHSALLAVIEGFNNRKET